MTLHTVSSSDQDLFDLMQYYNETGIIEKNEFLLAELRTYLDQRFNFMSRTMMLQFCTFLKDLGMLFEDRDLILKLEDHFKDHFSDYQLTELF